MRSDVRFKRAEAGEYTAMDAGGNAIGRVVRTGEPGRDDYPWDWHYKSGERFKSGSEATARDAKSQIRWFHLSARE